MDIRTSAMLRSQFTRLLHNRDGATTLEWALLLGFIALPAYWIIRTLLVTLTSHYALMTSLNAMPLP